VRVFLRVTRGEPRDTHANLESILGHVNHRRRKGAARLPQAVSKLHGTRRSAVASIKAEADRRAQPNVLPIIREAQKAGATTLRQIAEALNAHDAATARGGQWYATSVSNVLRGSQTCRSQWGHWSALLRCLPWPSRHHSSRLRQVGLRIGCLRWRLADSVRPMPV
jgi:hypothetical protein